MGVAGFTSTQQQFCFLFEWQSASPLLKPTFILSSSTCFFHVLFVLPFFHWPSTSRSNTLTLSPQHMTIPTNTACHSQLVYSFLQTQHEHQIHRSFSVFELHSTHCSHHGSFCPSLNFHLTFLQTPCFTSIRYCWSCITLINCPFQF